MERPLVSIVTPVLNRAETIGACLDSVTRQTYRPIEHIVVDGQSTDGTLERISEHRPSHPFRWTSAPDNGMYEAINKGLSLAHGEVLAYLNSDDLYLPWSVDEAIRALRPGVDMVYGDLGILLTGADGSPSKFFLQFYPEFDLRYYSFVGTLAQPTVFWRRSLTERIGLFDSQYRLIGDCEYWLRAALHGARLSHISELIAIQVEHDSTLRATQKTRLREEFEALRVGMMSVITPPFSPRWEWLKRRIVWRIRLLEFFYQMKATRPHKWRRFVGTLSAYGIDVSWHDLRVLAPARWRGNASLFRDAARIREILASPRRP